MEVTMSHKVSTLESEQFFTLFDDELKPKVWNLGKFKHQNYFSFNLKLPEVMPAEFNRSISYILEHSGMSLRGQYIDKYKRHYLLVLLNLARSLLCKQWLLIPMNTGAYRPGSNPHRNGFTLRYMKDILDILHEAELIYVKKGKKYTIQPQLTAIQPSERFGAELCLIALESSSEFAGDYVSLSKPHNDYTPSQIHNEQLIRDRDDMNTINSFIESHSWPMKGPLKRIYSGEVGLSGRIYCDFQAIPKRTIRIRPTCLIDEDPIAEVDIKSSHPRLAAQIFEDIKLSRDFYREVSDDTNIFASKVKDYFRVALSSDKREGALAAFNNMEQINSTYDFTLLEHWMADNYPNIPLYSGWSKIAMNIEGEIIKHVLLLGVEENKVVLPIHDAVALKVQDAEWGRNAIHKAWLRVMGKDYCEVDIEYPDNFEPIDP